MNRQVFDQSFLEGVSQVHAYLYKQANLGRQVQSGMSAAGTPASNPTPAAPSMGPRPAMPATTPAPALSSVAGRGPSPSVGSGSGY